MTAPVQLLPQNGDFGTALERARGIAAVAAEADGRPPVSDQALLAVAQGQRQLFFLGVDQASDQATTSPVVGFGILGEGEIDLVVDPAYRGRGIGTAALRLLLGEAEHTGTPLLSWSHGDNPAADALLAHAGFAPVRSLFLMELDPARLPHDGRDPLDSGDTNGVLLRAFDPGSASDANEWVRVNAAAFASHPEQGRITEADFAIMREEPWFDPDDLLLLVDAEAPGRVLGSTWIKTVRGEGTADTAPVAELYAIGVDPAYAGRGFGSLLLGATLARMAEHAPSAVELYVDGENARAVQLYERAGFTVRSRSRQWALSR